MRQLSHFEIQAISGAGYSEDIVTAAASLYVGSTIGRIASILTARTVNTAVAFVGKTSAIGTGLGYIGSILSPVMFFAAPALAFEYAYPGTIEKAVTSYFS